MSASCRSISFRVVWLALLVLASPQCTAAATRVLAITQVAVIDVVHGRASAPQTVLIEDDRIGAMGTGVTIPPAAQRIDGRGKFLVPGLVDLHVHLFNNASHRAPNEWAFALFIANGVTGVREMNTTPDELAQVRQWRDGVARGTLVAPHVLAAGVFPWVDTGQQARRAVREAAQRGADFIKVFSEVTPARWRIILDICCSQAIASSYSLCP